MRLDKLRILRTPGIHQPFDLEPGPGVNLITGPNGAGKSTVYRTVLNLLWPGHADMVPFEAAASFHKDGRTLEVARQDTAAPTWSGGRPDLGPDHLAGRYHLGALELQETVTSEDPLLREIRRHIAGGFDLESLRRDLFEAGRGIKESRDLNQALEKVADREKEQRLLAGEQDRLNELKEKQELAVRAGDRLRALEILGDLARHAALLAEAEGVLATLPQGVEKVRDEDQELMQRLGIREKDHQRQILASTLELEEIEQGIAGLTRTLGQSGDLPHGLLKKKLTALNEIQRDRQQCERDVAGKRDAKEKLAAIPPKGTPWMSGGALALGLTLLALGLGDLVLADQGLPALLNAGILMAGTAVVLLGALGLNQRRKQIDPRPWHLESEMDLARTAGELSALEARWAEALADFNTVIGQAGQHPVRDLEQASQALDDRKEQQERLKERTARRKQIQDLLDRDQRDLDRVRSDLTTMLDRLGLTENPDPPRQLDRLAASRPAFATALRQRDAARQEIQRLEQERSRWAKLLEPDESPDLLPETLEQKAAAERELADARDELQETIATIETNIARATGGHGLENALAEAAGAHADLQEARDNARAAALGSFLVDRVVDEHEVKTRPAVLAAAMEYFRRFTRNEYELRIAAEGSGGQTFLAATPASAHPLGLAELSDGTRAQLLLAVKLGFITAGEHETRPPIFLDDSLSSADPERFAAVARNLGELARDEKRQVFYLSPNPTDAAAWQRALAAAGLDPATHIDLAQQRGLSGTAEARLLDPRFLDGLTTAPEPRGMNAAEYAAAVLAPTPDPWSPGMDLHLVFLLHDNLPLVKRLIDAGAPTLVRFERGSETLLHQGRMTQDEADAIRARGNLWRSFLAAWRVGRPVPVPRTFFQESTAVSKAFTPRIVELSEACGKDARRLMEALWHGELKGFLKNKKEQLQQELELAGYLDGRKPFDSDKLRLQTIAGLGGPTAGVSIDTAEIHRFVMTFEHFLEPGNSA